MRRRLVSRVILAVAVAVLIRGAAVLKGQRRDELGSYADGVALDAEGAVQLLPANSGAVLLPGSRVLGPASEAAMALAQDQRTWLASGWLPQEHREMVSGALLDMRVLSVNGAATAAQNANWRYVWPRDASFVAAAFAVSDHGEDAVEILEFLQRVQAADGSFEARYLPDESGTPDGRAPQTDGSGWVLWALDVVVAEAPPESRAGLLAQFDPLLQRSTAYLRSEVDNRLGLPSASLDYWEHRERLVTLGTAAPVLAGLEASALLFAVSGDAAAADRSQAAAAKTREAIEIYFGSHDYPRYPGPSHPDAAVSFLLPPYQPTPLPGAVAAWEASVDSMMRPAGGLAPGGGWAEQNLSWTPETALYALAAASIGDDDQARTWLDWLETHRTPIGALPEKVNAVGEPAGPAPLAWTAALVVLTAAALER